MVKYVMTDSLWTKGKGGVPIVVAFGRNMDDPKDTIQLGKRGFEPYFYVPLPEWRRSHPNDFKVDATSCYGDPLRKVTVELPSQIPAERNLYAETFEADIPYDMRYLIDNGISYMFDSNLEAVESTQIGKPCIGYYDCEMIVEDGNIPNPNNPYHPMASICVTNNYNDDVVLFMIKSDEMEGINVD